MNTLLRKKQKMISKDIFSSWSIMQFLGKLWKIQRSRYKKLVTTERRKSYLVSEPSYHTTIFFSKSLLAMKMERTEIFVNKYLDLGLSIVEISKTVMYKFCRKDYGVRDNLRYMNTDSFIVSIETEDIYSKNSKCVETGFDNSNMN